MLSQLFSSANISNSYEITHEHEHFSFQGVKHTDKHSHVVLASTLFYELKSSFDMSPLITSIIKKEIKLPANIILNNIFKPPIS